MRSLSPPPLRSSAPRLPSPKNWSSTGCTHATTATITDASTARLTPRGDRPPSAASRRMRITQAITPASPTMATR